ncbi:hypothetical protein ACFV24_24175 [Nocardia fluminea]|uniref:hypothetical protein n=1 Tax=Nocardia fluminea TaxID=134984 RepID=UPI0036710B05
MGVSVVTQGWFNHYDDPDEFWDEEPLAVKERQGPAASEDSTYLLDSASIPSREQRRLGSSFVSMKLDRGFLPVRIEFSRSWSRYVEPHEVSDELMQAYQSAASDRLETLYSNNRLPTPQEVNESAIPDHRTIMMVLLETTSWDQYLNTFSRMASDAEYSVHGSVASYGENVVTVRADRRYIQSIAVQSNWAASADMHRISDELIWCADQIRSLRPNFAVSESYAKYSDEDLVRQLDRHREYLVQERINAHG